MLFIPTSPLVEYAGVRALLVRSSLDWEVFGRHTWHDMLDAMRLMPPVHRVMGVDCEWFNKNPLATVQVATVTHCIVIHLSYLDGRSLPVEVKLALEDPTIIKCGVGVSGDVKRLEGEQSLHMTSVLDLGNYAMLTGLAVNGKTNLCALLSSACNGATMEKDKWITRSNWELPMYESQFRYCADDAVASFMIGAAIMRAVVHSGQVDVANFHAGEWLASTHVMAATAYRHTMRERNRENNDEMKRQALARKTAAVAMAATGEGGGGLPAILPSAAVKVKVLDQSGQLLFECSQARAKFYVETKGIAEVTRLHKGNLTKPAEICLLFQNQSKVRLCMYDAIGQQCELQEHCPFAHGLDDLAPESAPLLTDPKAFSCAFCLNRGRLMRHVIVPPSFRRHLPKPLRYTEEEVDIVPVCSQCNTFIREYYDLMMTATYHEAQQGDPSGRLDMEQVGKCVSYARLLGDAEKLRRVPEERQRNLAAYVIEHWASTRMQVEESAISDDDFDGNDNGGGCADDALVKATEATTASINGNGEKHGTTNGSNHKKEGADADEAAAAAQQQQQPGFDGDWESLEGDDADATCKAAADATTTLPCRRYRLFRNKNGTHIPVFAADSNASSGGEAGATTAVVCPGGLNPLFLDALAHVVPGDVRARVTMERLVGRDKTKAEEFIAKWRTFATVALHMIDKPGNHMTPEDWITYETENQARKENMAVSEAAAASEGTTTTRPCHHDAAAATLAATAVHAPAAIGE